ncbi:hypothetical protein DPMN_074105 [Dreissena polymorpha]|uniref:Uncharacterized protein n=1 Tax=Dreissena polymorpha TaxID=45954 RepID=A0A9D4BLB9_DREPO|nr:hypothetical protein DPMN_074105 [Dreissena polymorpha]
MPRLLFHGDRTINVASRVFTRFYYSPIFFQPTGTIFKLIQDSIGTNLLTKFHDNQTINVASRVLTGFYYSHILPYKTVPIPKMAKKNTVRENAPPPGGHVFQPTGTIFQLIQDSIGTNLLTKFHDNRTINKKCPSRWRSCFSSNNIVVMNLLTKFHKDQWTINVA